MLAVGLLSGALLAPFLGFVLLVVLRLRGARIGYLWLSAFLGVTFSWICLIGLRFFLPIEQQLATWQPQSFFPLSPALLADESSWPIGLALVTLALAVILSEASAQGRALAFGWASSTLLLSLGLFAIFAGNQLTLLLAWAAIDLVELAIWLSRPAQPTLRERVVLAFASRAFAVMLSLWGLGNPWAYVFSVILRWGVFPFHLPYLESADLRRGLGTMIRLVPPLTTMPFLARLADLAFFPTAGWISLFLGLVAVFASILWVNSRDDLESRPFWIIAVASFAFWAAERHLVEAVLGWALILAFSGSFLFLLRARHRYWVVALGYQTALLLSLPYTPYWVTASVYSGGFSFTQILWLLSQLFIVMGYVRLFLQKPKAAIEGEPWSKALYALALVSLMIVSLFLGYGGWGNALKPSLTQPAQNPFSGVQSFIGLGLGSVSLVLLVLWRRRLFPHLRLPRAWEALFSLEWLFRLIQWGFRQFGVLYYQIEALLEGRGGILWAMVLLLVLARVFLFFLGENNP